MKLLNGEMKGKPSKIFLYAIFLAYPLAFHDYYYDIVTCKYVLLIAMTLGLFIFTVFMEGRAFLREFKFCPSDFLVIGIFIINLLSVIGSEYKIYALNGADGRNNGIITVFLYVIIYFILSRGIYDKDKLFAILAVGSMFVAGFGILNFVNIDVFGFYDGLQMEQKQFYMSTLGHVNVYASYFSLTLPVLVIRYMEEKQKGKAVFYYIASVLNITGLICSGCESAGIILIVTIIVTVFYCRRFYALKWFSLMSLFLIFHKGLVYINKDMAEPRMLSRVAELLADKRIMTAIFMINIFLFLAEMLLKRKKKNGILRRVIISICVLVPFVYVLSFFYFTFINKTADLQGMNNFLRFSDEFGSYRGYIWKVVLEEYRKLPVYQKLFGIGSDVLRPFLVDIYGMNMYNVTMAYYDNAHNEYLQYLITIGITGLLSYLSFVVMQIKKAAGQADKIIVCSIICYLVQALVNINQVVTTPLLFVMLSLIGTKDYNLTVTKMS